jgi:HD superfamily phosphohydrolase
MAPASTKTQVIRDPVYGYIELSPRLGAFVDHRLFQRLRRVGQTSMTATVYPASTGSRFEHSLGAMHLGRRAWRVVWRKIRSNPELWNRFVKAVGEEVELPSTEFDLIIEDAVGAVALLHDLGHPPFSHVLEPVFDRLGRRWVQDERRDHWIKSGGAFHEFAGMILVDQILDDLSASLDQEFRDLVKLIYEAKPSVGDWKGTLHSIVAGEIDVDRLDYLMRDAQKAGTEFGAIDYERLIEALEMQSSAPGKFRIAPSIQARSAVETLLIQRTQSYRWITFHARVVGANLSLQRAFELLLDFSEDGRSLELPGAGAVALSELFDPLVPPLNYLAPSTDELRRIQSHVPGWRSDEAAETELLRKRAFGELIQTAVDDPNVLSALERASLLSGALLAEPNLSTEVIRDLQKFRAYTESIFARRKNIVAAWKTVDDLERIAMGDPFRKEFEETIDKVFDDTVEELKREGKLGDSGKKALEHERKMHHQRLREHPVAELNDIFSALLADGDPNQGRLCTMLDQASTTFEPGTGFWDLSFARFRAIEEREEKLSILFQKHREKGLVASSPIVRSLKDVADERIRLFVFYYVVEGDLRPWKEESVDFARVKLVTVFLPTFLEFLRQAWPDYLKIARTVKTES